MSTHKVIAIVKFNKGHALVLADKIKTTANRYGNTIIESDGVFFSSLVKEGGPGNGAFANKKFDIQLENGEVVHCHGDWWSGYSEQSYKIVGKNIVSATANDIESLRKCYVFSGHETTPEKWDQLINSYTGRIYGYWEYEAILKGKSKPHRNDRIDFRKKKNHRRDRKKFFA